MTEGVTLRKYPYPNRSALTICSEIDVTTPEECLEIHRFLNTKQRTPMSVGEGLEIGDSFWMYSAAPEPWRSLSVFNGLEPLEGPWSATGFGDLNFLILSAEAGVSEHFHFVGYQPWDDEILGKFCSRLFHVGANGQEIGADLRSSLRMPYRK